MMTIGGTAHILMLVATIVIIAVLMFVCSRVSPKWQNVMIHSAVLIGMVGILFLHLTRRGTVFDPQNFFVVKLYVCKTKNQHYFADFLARIYK